MECKKLFDVIDQLYPAYLDVWEDVCNLESPTADKVRVDGVLQYFLRLAQARGWAVDVLHQEVAGDAACITLNPLAPSKPIAFSGHIDTVHPVGLFGYPPVRRDGENIYGPGVTDCKGGVVASFLAMDALDRCGFRDRPVKLILQSDEETSSKASGKKTVAYMCRMAADCAAFLNTEFMEGHTAVLIRKGILRYQFHITGKAVHSSLCYRGANAVAEAAHKILRLEEYKDPEGLTINCGVIRGGTVSNTVAEQCSFTVDIRFADATQYAQAVELVQNVAQTVYVSGCSCRLEEVSLRPAMPYEERNQHLLEQMNRIYGEVGLPELTGRKTPSGSDAAHTTQAGIPSIDSIGVEGGDIHSVREWANMESLARCAKRLASVAMWL